MNNNEYKIVLIDLLDCLKTDYNKISDLLSSIFDANPNINQSYIVFELEKEKCYKDYHLNELIDLLKDDFNANINIFESNILNQNCNKDELINCYLKYKPSGYCNVSKLSLDIINKNPHDLELIKNCLLYSLNMDSDLIKITKAMFHNNLNVSKTANDVYMHRNTVINKLDVIERKTGLDLQSFEDSVIMYMLIMKNDLR